MKSEGSMLRRRGDKYIWTGGYDTRHIPKEAGFRWDPEGKVWWTKLEDVATKLMNYAEGDLKAELESYAKGKRASLEASKATSADIEIPHPAGLDYLPFQKAGIKYALERENTFFGDEMGLGKTVETIGVINATDVKKILVVCPASLKINWRNELAKWLTRPLTFGIADSTTLPDTDIVIVNYESLTKHDFSGPWDLVVADECHYAKNPKAQRTQALLGWDEKGANGYIHTPGITDKSARLLFLSGSPILNRPIELWPLVHALAPKVFPSFWAYAKRYCNAYQGRYGWDLSGASNLGELHDKIRSVFLLRRLKKDVLKELPPKVRQVVEVPANGALDAIRQERDAYARQEERLLELEARVELAEGEEAYKAAVRALNTGRLVAFAEMARERHEVALAKVPAVVDILTDALEEHPVVCFAHHLDVIAAIVEAFPGRAVKLTGEDTLEERQAAIDAFQSGKVDLFVGGIKAAGLGITLTASSHVVFAELDWVPGIVTQAEDRCHRIGQKDSVLVQHLVLDGSIDAHLAKTLIEKQAVIDAALDIEPTSTPGGMPVSEPSVTPVEVPSVEAPVVSTPGVSIEAVHECLKFLARRCDGAVRLDGSGFNKLDADIGRKFADLPSLTPRQALLGARIIKKYHRQLPAELLEKVVVGRDDS